MLMNNETIFDSPGWKQRAVKFLTEDSAATSDKGYGEAPCAIDKPALEQRAKEEAARAKLKKKEEAAVVPSPAPSGQSTLEVNAQPTATPTPSPDEINANLYDELMTRNYICPGRHADCGRARQAARNGSADHRRTEGMETDWHRSAYWGIELRLHYASAWTRG